MFVVEEEELITFIFFCSIYLSIIERQMQMSQLKSPIFLGDTCLVI